MSKIIYKKRGIFRPKRTDDLRPEMVPGIGKEYLFTTAGTMDEGPYSGQEIFQIHEMDGTMARLGWVPAEDIEWLE